MNEYDYPDDEKPKHGESGDRRTQLLAAIIGAVAVIIAGGTVINNYINVNNDNESLIRTQVAIEMTQTAFASTQTADTVKTATPTSLTATPGVGNTQEPTQPQDWQPACNWEHDWQEQTDGITYIWTGLPVGTEDCPMVGQEGDLLRRMGEENLIFIIDVGTDPLPLDICPPQENRPGFEAEIVEEGIFCAGQNRSMMPKVAGILTVTGSVGVNAGFTVGYQL